MSDLNSITLTGRLCDDPRLTYLPNKTPVVNLRVAANRQFTDGQGQKQKESIFIDAEYFGKVAETINQYLTKGSKVGLSGRLRQQNWEGPDGSKRSKIVIRGEEILFLDSQGQGQKSENPL